MKHRLYRLLVSRVPEIRRQYETMRQGRWGKSRVLAFLYLLFLNLRHYLPGGGCGPLWDENRPLCCGNSESAQSRREDAGAFAQRLAGWDVISFDVFDTLLLRPFSQPADLFYLVGMELGYPDFRRIRIKAEEQARQQRREQGLSPEVTLDEIWQVMERETGIPRQVGIAAEWECEKRVCFANPYMLRVVKALRAMGRQPLAISDMYLGWERLRELLRAAGYGEWETGFVSCDYRISKSGGDLYRMVRRTLGEGMHYVHVGDHPHADVRQASRCGIQGMYYPACSSRGEKYRAQDMSPVTGSLYRGMVDTHLHNGLRTFSREYEYGYVYGGLFVVGFCRFIHRYVQAHAPQRLLFLSRDGDVLLQAYRRMYPQHSGIAVYAYWSRLAALKLTASHFKTEYFDRFLFHKAGQGFCVGQALRSMELEPLLSPLCHEIGLKEGDELTHKTAAKIQHYLQEHWEQVKEAYRPQVEAAGAYYAGLLKGCRRAAAVDIGWAGSGAVMLNDAVNRLWGMDCPVTGLLGGALSAACSQPDASESLLWGGQLVSYLYSSGCNRDLWKFHDPAAGHNLYWELLLGAQHGSLQGFYPRGDGRPTVRLREDVPSPRRIEEIHRGILDFVEAFLNLEKRIGREIPVSGRDAYAPMVAVCSRRGRRFMDGLEGLLDDAHIG